MKVYRKKGIVNLWFTVVFTKLSCFFLSSADDGSMLLQNLIPFHGWIQVKPNVEAKLAQLV